MNKRFFALIEFSSGKYIPVVQPTTKGDDEIMALWETEQEAKMELRNLSYYGQFPIWICDMEKGWSL